jgi:class 3 adenylate cyclase
VPTLVLHRTGDRDVPIEGRPRRADRIAGATFVELPSAPSHGPRPGSAEIEAFVTGARAARMPRVLATVLFTDIVGSMKTAELGDARWKELLVHDEGERDR